MTTTLPIAPNLEQLKKQSKELLRAFRAQNPESANRFLDHHPELDRLPIDQILRIPLQLADAQLVIARELGFASWPKLKDVVQLSSADAGRDRKRPKLRREDGRVWIDDVGNVSWGRDRETTFCGALETALAITDQPFSYTDLMGFSGLAFRTRWYQSRDPLDCCPSSPVGEFPEEISAISRATGWPVWIGHRLGDGDDKSMAPYWQEIVNSIDEGRPMLGYNLKLDVGIIHGYVEEGKRIIGWDYHHPGDEPLDIPIEKMGPWIAFIDQNEGPQPTKDAFLNALSICSSNYRREPEFEKPRPYADYGYGSNAFATWASDILNADPSQGEYYGKLYFVGWWTFNCLFDARLTAGPFLREHADLLSTEAGAAVRQAANLYDDEVALLKRTFTQRDVFFGPWSGKSIEDWTRDVRDEENDLLKAAAEIERKAVILIDQAIQGS
jgi:hypothetical protein